MLQKKWWGKFLRVVGIVLMGFTAGFTLMGGAGTTCVALNPTGYGEKFISIAPFQWLYIAFVLVTIAVGVMGVRAFVLLCQAKHGAYRFSLITLSVGILVGGLHILTSRILRGSSMPVDMVVYITVLTLIIFLLFRIPRIWQEIALEKGKNDDGVGKNAAALSLAVIGILSLTIQFIMAPTHTISGVNYADVWHIAFSVIGGVLIISSILMHLIQKNMAVTIKKPVMKQVE